RDRCARRLPRLRRTPSTTPSRSFDIARQGSLDPLPGGHGRHTIEGDTREMIAARARVLEAALFEPLAACVAAIASASLARTAALRASTGDADTTSVIL